MAIVIVGTKNKEYIRAEKLLTDAVSWSNRFMLKSPASKTREAFAIVGFFKIFSNSLKKSGIE